MKVGSSFIERARSRRMPGLAGDALRLDVDVVEDLEVVGDEADRPDDELAHALGRPSRRISSRMSGPSHGSPVRPALWNANS